MNVFITVWNRHSWLIPLCEDFEKAGLNVILIDNVSTYEPCIEWLKNCHYQVLWMDQNYGPWAFFTTHLYKQYKDRYFMISDSDQDISNVPSDFPEVLRKGLDEYKLHDVWKCGLSQECEDLPDNACANEIGAYEKGFWANKTSHGFYHVAMDLGIAIYDRERRTENPTDTDENGHTWYNAIRAPRPYTSRHLDWYLTPENMRTEDHYYFNSKNYAHYGWGFKYYNEVYRNKMNFTELFAVHGRSKYLTDKGDDHTYFGVYDKIFAPHKEKSIRVLEIGISSGGSLKLFEDYFINAQIFGVDKSHCDWSFDGRVTTYECDFKDIDYDNYDIVIDDCSHYLEDQLWVVENVLPKINDGGMLVIEDVMHPDKVKDKFEAVNSNFEIIDLNHLTPDKNDNALIIYRK